MSAGEGEPIVIEAWPHPRFGWVMIPLSVGRIVVLDMVLNTGLPVSSIGPSIRDLLIMKELIPPTADRAYVLHDLTIQERSIAGLVVRVRPRLDQLGVSGILGLDFLRQFSEVRFHLSSFRLALFP